MASKQVVVTTKAPKTPSGVYSQVIVSSGFVFVSGAVPVDAVTGKLVDGDIKVHTHQSIKNLSAMLSAAGSSLDKVVQINVFLASMDDYAKMNEVYTTYWGDAKPCRTCVAVKSLPLNADIEIECTAVL